MQRRLRHKPGLRHAPFIQRGKALYRDRAASVFNPERRVLRRVCAGVSSCGICAVRAMGKYGEKARRMEILCEFC